MTIHPAPTGSRLSTRPQQERPDSTSAYDSTWAEEGEAQPPEGLDRVMGADGKIYVVLTVVLLIWFGVLTLLVRTDRKIDRLERQIDDSSSPDDASPRNAS